VAFGWVAAACSPLFAGTATSTTLAVTAAGAPVTTVAAGTTVTLTATVLAGSTPVTPGQVKFCDATAAYCEDIHILGLAQLTSAGTATFKYQPAAGSHSYKAVFVGTTANAGSSSSAAALTVTILPGTSPTTTSITASGTQGNFTLSTTVTCAPGYAPPTGTVSFLDVSSSNSVLASAALTPGGTGLQWTSGTYPTGAQNALSQVAVADFNGDGIADLAVTVYNAASSVGVNILLGNGDGTFTPSALALPALYGASTVVTGDFNGDGIPDLAVQFESPSTGASMVAILLGSGDGTFTEKANYPVSAQAQSFAYSILVGDFNGDGVLDLVLPNGEGNTIDVLLGNGDGTFSALSPNTSVPGNGFGNGPSYGTVGDFNGDGILDLALTLQTADNVVILFGNGDGTFAAPIVTNDGIPGTLGIATADFNGDGIPDLAVTVVSFGATSQGAVVVLLGNGDGTFKVGQESEAVYQAQNVVVGDFNGDGNPDLAVTSPNQNTGVVTVLLGNGDGTFSPSAISPTVGDGPNYAAVGDFNGSGVSELAVANQPSNAVAVFLSGASATATASAISLVGSGTHQVEASYPGDSTHGSSISATTPLTVPKAYTSLILTASATSAQYGQPVTLTATLIPYAAYGQSSNGETITFRSGSSVLGTSTLASGVATLSVISFPPGNDVLTAAYAGDADLDSSTSNQVTIAAGITTLTLTVSPASPEAPGQPVTLTATLSPYSAGSQSTNGETITFYSGGVNLGTGTLASGVATFTTPNLPVGSDALTAIFNGDSPYLASSLSNQVTVTVGVTALTLTVNPPNNSYLNPVAGQPITLTATLSPFANAGFSADGEIIMFTVRDIERGQNTLTGTLSGGVATVTTTSLPADFFEFSASYGGDSHFSNATSNFIEDYLVVPARPALTLAVNPVNSTVGGSVTLTATLSGGDAAVNINGEAIFFNDAVHGGTSLGTGTLASGVATLTTASLPAGLNNLSASYGGDLYNSSANSDVVLESVAKTGQAATSVTLAVTGGGAVVTTVAQGVPITLTATVTSAGTPVTPGTITFCDSTGATGSCTTQNALGTAQLTSNGTAAITIRLGLGSHGLQALFNGTPSKGVAVSSPAPLTVTGKYASKVVASVPSSITNGIYDFNVSVHGIAPDKTPSPTGSVQAVEQDASNTVLSSALVGNKYDNPDYRIELDLLYPHPVVGSKPFAMAAGDFNNDGNPDLAVANSGDNTVSVMLGKGDGSFQTQVTYATGSGPYSVAVGDFNGDGFPDLAVANFSDNTVSILLGKGDGTFQTQKTYAAGGAPNSVVTGDFDGDGNLDLAVANNTDGTVSILLGQGDGTFQAQKTFATGSGPTSIALSDFNLDGKLDLAVTNFNDDTVSILLGNGDGTFAAQATYATGKNPISVAVYHGTDLAVANFGDTSLSLFLSNGDGTFQPEVSTSVYDAGGMYAVVPFDLSGEGFGNDLAVANSTRDAIQILQGSGNPTAFSGGAVVGGGAGPVSLAAADFNGDGIEDLAVLDNTSGLVNVLLNESGPNVGPPNGDLAADLPPGTENVDVVYSGDSNFQSSSAGPFTLTTSALPTTLTLVSSTSLSNYGNPVTLTATLSFQDTAANSDGDTVTFTVGSTVVGTATLSSNVATLITTALPVGIDTVVANFAATGTFNASAAEVKITIRPAGLTVTAENGNRAYGAPNPALSGTVQGAVNGDTFTVTSTTTATQTSPAGAYTVVPSVSGAHLSDYSVTKVNGTLTVTQATPTLTVTPAASSISPTQSLSVTVAVTGAIGAAAPTGTVKLGSGAYTSSATALSSGSATITIPAGSLAVGSDTLTASYTGDPNYNTTTGTAPITVANPTYTVAGTAVSVAPGAATGNASTITITPGGGFTGSVSMTATLTASPAGATKLPTFSFGATTPVSITAAGAGTATLTIDTMSATSTPCNAANQMPREIPWYAGGSAVLAGLFFFAIPARRRRVRTMLGMLFLLAAFAGGVLACGGGGSTPCTPTSTPGTTAGSYAITVTGTSGAITQTGTVSLTVQ
jgi:hypothetical protein